MLHSIIPPLDLWTRFSTAGANKYKSATSRALGEEAILLMQRWVGFSLSSWNQKLQPLHKRIHRMCPAAAKWEILLCTVPIGCWRLLNEPHYIATFPQTRGSLRFDSVFPLKCVPAPILTHDICSRKCGESNVGDDQNVFLRNSVFASWWNVFRQKLDYFTTNMGKQKLGYRREDCVVWSLLYKICI